MFDEFLDALDHVFQIAVVVGVYLIPFQCLYKALATGVVVRIPWPTHAWHHAPALQPRESFLTKREVHSWPYVNSATQGMTASHSCQNAAGDAGQDGESRHD